MLYAIISSWKSMAELSLMLIVSKSLFEKDSGDPNGKNPRNMLSRFFAVMWPAGYAFLNATSHWCRSFAGKCENCLMSLSMSSGIVLTLEPIGQVF
ncbi:hypothetical protein HK407_04g07250 [Ordospora pajunii]|uniref:uncharacterized protein n=1 Tax=Ordospora pajunii TaxID=3039483 RepID=UPI00295266B1|nr:uncharacterized protein HK407_04g07250 [Ordospora pajunii]KAH9411618.1 hypothetical protein HK407_04g07250 [Ordospora pajunii]